MCSWKVGRRSTFFYRKIVFSDEAHFWLHEYVNKQTCRFWSDDQPELQKLPMHPEKVTVWCGLWAVGIIGPYLFKDAANRNATVNDERYHEIVANFFLPKMQDLLRGSSTFGTGLLAESIMRFNAFRLFFVGLYLSSCLYRQARLA